MEHFLCHVGQVVTFFTCFKPYFKVDPYFISENLCGAQQVGGVSRPPAPHTSFHKTCSRKTNKKVENIFRKILIRREKQRGNKRWSRQGWPGPSRIQLNPHKSAGSVPSNTHIHISHNIMECCILCVMKYLIGKLFYWIILYHRKGATLQGKNAKGM